MAGVSFLRLPTVVHLQFKKVSGDKKDEPIIKENPSDDAVSLSETQQPPQAFSPAPAASPAQPMPEIVVATPAPKSITPDQAYEEIDAVNDELNNFIWGLKSPYSHGCIHIPVGSDHILADYLGPGSKIIVHDYSEAYSGELPPLLEKPAGEIDPKDVRMEYYLGEESGVGILYVKDRPVGYVKARGGPPKTMGKGGDGFSVDPTPVGEFTIAGEADVMDDSMRYPTARIPGGVLVKHDKASNKYFYRDPNDFNWETEAYSTEKENWIPIGKNLMRKLTGKEWALAGYDKELLDKPIDKYTDLDRDYLKKNLSADEYVSIFSPGKKKLSKKDKDFIANRLRENFEKEATAHNFRDGVLNGLRVTYYTGNPFGNGRVSQETGAVIPSRAFQLKERGAIYIHATPQTEMWGPQFSDFTQRVILIDETDPEKICEQWLIGDIVLKVDIKEIVKTMVELDSKQVEAIDYAILAETAFYPEVCEEAKQKYAEIMLSLPPEKQKQVEEKAAKFNSQLKLLTPEHFQKLGKEIFGMYYKTNGSLPIDFFFSVEIMEKEELLAFTQKIVDHRPLVRQYIEENFPLEIRKTENPVKKKVMTNLLAADFLSFCTSTAFTNKQKMAAIKKMTKIFYKQIWEQKTTAPFKVKLQYEQVDGEPSVFVANALIGDENNLEQEIFIHAEIVELEGGKKQVKLISITLGLGLNLSEEEAYDKYKQTMCRLGLQQEIVPLSEFNYSANYLAEMGVYSAYYGN